MTNQNRIYARVENGVYLEKIMPLFYETEAEGWVEGDPSRIGMFIPVEERYPTEFVAMMHEITDLDPMPQPYWTYDYDSGIFSPPIAPPIEDELALAIRQTRDMLLRTVYDPGISMALRAQRMADTPQNLAYAASKIVELDNYAESLLAVPEQDGFPHSVLWPDQPVK
jgi:hypothetical protein